MEPVTPFAQSSRHNERSSLSDAMRLIQKPAKEQEEGSADGRRRPVELRSGLDLENGKVNQAGGRQHPFRTAIGDDCCDGGRCSRSIAQAIAAARLLSLLILNCVLVSVFRVRRFAGRRMRFMLVRDILLSQSGHRLAIRGKRIAHDNQRPDQREEPG